jgi:hypothetical protein
MADAPLHIIPADLLEAQVQLEQQGRRPQLRTSTTGGWQYFHTQLPPTQQQVGGSCYGQGAVWGEHSFATFWQLHTTR